ncbi:Uncharacterized protein yheV [Escherichia coli LF82]|nr:Uncharacterized protein yheV [Escherichia coli LF82]
MRAQNARPVRHRIQWRCGAKIILISLNVLSVDIRCEKQTKKPAITSAKMSK